MKKPTLLQISEVRVADVIASNRLRPVSQAAVDSLINSLNELGVLKDEIHTRKLKDGKIKLIAGAHRLEAFKQLEREMIPAKVWAECSNDWALLMEIDDNVAGAELNPLDTAIFLARRKELWERLYPETSAGAFKGNQHTKVVTDTMSFTKTTAEKFGMSVRHVERLVAAGSRIRDDQAAKLRSAVRPVTLKDLGELAKIENTDERLGVIDALASGFAKSAADGRRKWAAKDAPSVEGVGESTKDAAFKAILKAWQRAPLSARKRFLFEAASEVWEVQNKGVPLNKWAEADDV
jgi:ParB family chromosome partitioning protein